MNDVLLKEELKTLRKMRGRDAVPESEIHNLWHLRELGVIEQNYQCFIDSGESIPEGTYRLTDKYWRFAKYKRECWLWRFIPIVISVFALIISACSLLK